MKPNHGAMPEPDVGHFRADAICASFAGTTLYAATVTAAWLDETVRWIDQWCSLSARFCYAGPVQAVAHSVTNAAVGTAPEVPHPISQELSDAGIHAESADSDWFEEDEMLPRITNEEMLANPRSMEFNLALHEMQERVFAGELLDAHPYELPPGYKPALRPWSKDMATEPAEL